MYTCKDAQIKNDHAQRDLPQITIDSEQMCADVKLFKIYSSFLRMLEPLCIKTECESFFSTAASSYVVEIPDSFCKLLKSFCSKNSTKLRAHHTRVL